MSKPTFEKERHPEQRKHELYMGNTDMDGFQKSSWNTKRMGTLALGADGEPVDRFSAETLRPWFIAASEVEATLKTATGEGQEYRAEVYRKMLVERGV